jgi:VWFA-related protein
MGKPFRIGAGLLLCVPALGLAQQTSPSAGSASLPASMSSPASVTGDALVKLDVVVTEKSGKSVAGLEPKDFTLLDNGLPEKTLSFQSFDGITARPDPPVEVILVIDTLNLTPDKSSLAKSEVERFLRRNNGHLAQPVSIYLLSNTGLSSMPQPVADGNALAEAIALGRDLPVVRQSPAFRVGQTYAENGQIVRLTAGGIANRSSVKSLASIAIEERRKPGRKLLFWLGPGWPVEVLGGDIAFDSITELSTRLREARISLWSATEWPYPDTHFAYQDYLAPLKSGERVQSGNLALGVLAIQSGGGLLETSSDLEGAIRKCIEKESTFYTLTFDPPFANEEDDYHDLRLVVGKPDLTALTNTGYYNQPVYHDHPSEAKRISVEQLEQMLGAAHGGGDKEVAQELFGVELTERMSSTKLSSWKTRLPGERSRAALVGVADRSAFLALPATDVPATAPPDTHDRLFEQDYRQAAGLLRDADDGSICPASQKIWGDVEERDERAMVARDGNVQHDSELPRWQRSCGRKSPRKESEYTRAGYEGNLRPHTIHGVRGRLCGAQPIYMAALGARRGRAAGGLPLCNPAGCVSFRSRVLLPRGSGRNHLLQEKGGIPRGGHDRSGDWGHSSPDSGCEPGAETADAKFRHHGRVRSGSHR